METNKGCKLQRGKECLRLSNGKQTILYSTQDKRIGIPKCISDIKIQLD